MKGERNLKAIHHQFKNLFSRRHHHVIRRKAKIECNKQGDNFMEPFNYTNSSKGTHQTSEGGE